MVRIEVKSRKVGSKINSEIIADSNLNENDMFYYDIFCDGERISKSGWTRESVYEYEPEVSGSFQVKGWLMRGEEKVSSRSQVLAFFSLSDSTMDESIIPPLEFYKLKYPYHDFCLLHLSDDNKKSYEALKTFENDGFYIRYKGTENKAKKATYLMSTCQAKTEGNLTYLFSGTTKHDKRLIFGNEDVKSGDQVNEFVGNIGNFHLIRIEECSIRIDTDYFGIGKIYYYDKDGIFVAANRYHLLLITLAKIGVKCTLNIPKATTTLAYNSHHFFSQNFTREMSIKDTFVLPIDKRIEIDNDGIKVKNSAIHETLYVNEDFSEELYLELLEEAKQELLDNAKAALNCSRFSHYIADLTGGKDSRLVYATLINLPEFHDIIRLNCGEVVKGERSNALSLNSMYELPYSDVGSTVQMETHRKGVNDERSYRLGTYYSHLNSFQTKVKHDNALNFTGFYGEITCRPYFSAPLMEKMDGKSLNEFVSAFLDYREKSSVVPGDAMLRDILKELLLEELSQLPGKTVIEKYDLSYLFYRNGLHCNDNFRNPAWGILQSKTLFRLKMMTFNKFKSMKLQLDIMLKMNPLMLSVPFHSAADQLAVEKLKDSLHYEDDRFQNLLLHLNPNASAWNEAERKRAAGVKYLQNVEERTKLKKSPEEAYALRHEQANVALKYIFNYNEQNDNSEALERVLSNCIMLLNRDEKSLDEKKAITHIQNKVISLYYELKAFE